jgi:putative two-component system response regulator
MNRMPCVVVGGGAAEARRHVAAMLRDEPWHIVGVADGDAVLELARSFTADIVLLESHQPGFDGYDICRRLRRTAENRLLPIVLMSALDDIGSRVAALEAGADDFLSRPLERSELIARVRSLLHLKSTHDRLEDARQVIFALAKAAEAKDVFTLEHAERVADHASELARSMRLAPDVVEQIRIGALIHDVGKIAVPDHVLNKPGALSGPELKVVKTHTQVGAEIVAPLAAQRHLVGIVRSHHERYDGAGYPDGLAGKAIPLAARMVAVCDAFDAMTNQRPYRAAMSQEDAVAALKAGRNKQWDGELVDAFVAIYEHR